MEFNNVLNKRITTLRYRDKKVKRENIDKIISSAIIAPSAKNRQPWRFYILNQEQRYKIADIMDKWEKGLKENELKLVTTIHRSANIIRTVSDFILVYKCGEKVIYKEAVDILSVGAAIENMILTATNLGIDTTWIADVRFIIYEINKYLNIEENLELMSGIAFGYRECDARKKGRYKKEYLILNKRLDYNE